MLLPELLWRGLGISRKKAEVADRINSHAKTTPTTFTNKNEKDEKDLTAVVAAEGLLGVMPLSVTKIWKSLEKGVSS